MPKIKDPDAMAAIVLDSIAGAFTKGAGVMQKQQQLKMQQQAAADKKALDATKEQRAGQKHNFATIKHVHEFGGTDPVSGRVITREESGSFQKQQMDQVRLKNSKLSNAKLRLQLESLRKKGAAPIKLSVNESQQLVDGQNIPGMIDDLAKFIKDNPASFGYKAAVNKSGFARVVGEMQKSMGLGQNVLDEHDKLVGVNSKFNIGAQMLARSFEQRLTDKDREFYLKQMASILDNPEAGLNKLGAIKQLFVNKHKIFVDSLKRKGVPDEIIGPDLTDSLNFEVSGGNTDVAAKEFNIDEFLGD